MHRVALVSVDEATRTCLESVLAGQELVPVDSLTAAANRHCDLAVVGTHGDLDVAALAQLTGVCPVLIVASGREAVPSDVYDLERVAAIRAPFELFDLRAKIEALLAATPSSSGPAPPVQAGGSVATTNSGAAGSTSLQFPAVPQDAAAVLAVAKTTGASLWIAGPSGSGRERIVGELVEGNDALIVRPGEELLGAATVVVMGLEERSPDEQQRLVGWLSDRRGPRVVAVSADDPAELAASGRVDARLYHALAGLVAHLPALRERRAEIEALAKQRLSEIASRLQLGSLSLSATAGTRLANYPWPGNLTELDAVLTRSLVAAQARHATVLDADDLLLAPGFSRVAPPSSGSPIAGTQTFAEAAPDTHADGGSGEAPERPRSTSANVVRLDVHRGRAHSEGGRDSAVEPLVAGLAHELRNPLATIKTFASLAADDDGERSELARLAVAACDRLDRQLDVLGRYAEADSGPATTIDLALVFSQRLATRNDSLAVRVLCEDYRVRMDAELAAVIVDLLLDEIGSRLPPGRSAVLARPPRGASGLELAAPVDHSAERHLERHIADTEDAASWRIVLARTAAMRSGAAVTVDETEAMLTVRWDVAEVEEDERDETHAQSTDR